MSFLVDKIQLENEFAVLKQQIIQTNEAWDDPVQQRFYCQFVDILIEEFHAYVNELSKLDKAFEKAEQAIIICKS